MRIATISHSHVALRQQLFFQEVVRQGHEVLMVSPGEWFDYKVVSQERTFSHNYMDSLGKPYRTIGNKWELRALRHTGDNIYSYKLLGAKDIIENFKPDWLYVQAEPGSLTADEALDWKMGKRALFTWENINIKGNGSVQLPKYNLVICGNPEAEALVKPYNPHTALTLQVGVDTDHFQPRPDVPREVDVAYVGRPTQEKGIQYLLATWPTVKILPWADFKELPWRYSQVKVVVAYSQDTSTWREQAPNYVVLEALSCGCKCVVSDTASMKFWLEGCPGVIVVGGHQLDQEWGKGEQLKRGIKMALETEMEFEGQGRQWIVDNFSNVVMAKKLLEVLGNA